MGINRLKIRQTPTFKRDLKKMIEKKRRSRDKLVAAVEAIVLEERHVFVSRYHDHALVGKLKGFRELHIEQDWLLMYEINNDELILVLIRTGSHDALF